MNRRRALGLMGIGAAAGLMPQRLSGQAPSFPSGAIIRTVLRDYAPEDLSGGATLFHEHLQLAPDFGARFSAASAAVRRAQGLPAAAARGGRPASEPAPPEPDAAQVLAQKVAGVADAGRAGVACIVDAGHPDMGRDIDFLREVSSMSGVPVVAGGGFYSQPFYPREIAMMDEDEIVRALIRQADEDTPGAFGEIGSWDEMTVDERRVFRAIGRAHVATNIPIFTHTGIPGKAAIEQLNILEDPGSIRRAS